MRVQDRALEVCNANKDVRQFQQLTKQLLFLTLAHRFLSRYESAKVFFEGAEEGDLVFATCMV